MRSRTLAPCAVLLVATLAAACRTGAPRFATGMLTIETPSGPVTVRVEIADTEPARRQGLMGRTKLARDAGMVFLFEGPTRASFWMKDTLIPLSIGFWDSGGRLVAMLDMEPCLGNPCPLYSPGVVYVGAVEVDRGRFADLGVSTGDAVRLDRLGGTGS